MSTVTVPDGKDAKRREDFPVDSFRHMEAKLQEIRKQVMNLAAEIAEDADKTSDVYRIERGHVDQALQRFLSDILESQRILGLSCSARGNGASNSES